MGLVWTLDFVGYMRLACLRNLSLNDMHEWTMGISVYLGREFHFGFVPLFPFS